MIDEQVFEQVAEMIRRTKPRFGDITVGDINPDDEWECHLLDLATQGNDKATKNLCDLVDRKRKQGAVQQPYYSPFSTL